MVHSWATDVDDPAEQPRWGKVGKQRIEDAGALCPDRMKTVDDEILSNALKFADKARQDGKPFFLWLNPTRMHVVTHLSEKYEKMRTPKNGWSVEPDGGTRHWVADTVGFAGPDERYIVAAMYHLPPSVPTTSAGIHTGAHAVSDLVATVFGAPVPATVTVPDHE